MVKGYKTVIFEKLSRIKIRLLIVNSFIEIPK